MKPSCLAAAFVVLAALASPASAQTEAEAILCPNEGLELNVTTTLPEPWTSAPLGVRLSASEVQTDGDAVTLVCLYDPVGVVAQVMPDAYEDCAPAPGGFECTPIQADRLVARGPANLAVGAGLDLDTGTEQADRRLNDIWLTGLMEGNPVLESFNNTTFSVVPPDRPARLITCQEGRYELTRVVIGTDVAVRGSVCFQTDEGRFGIFTVMRSEETQIRIRFRTIR